MMGAMGHMAPPSQKQIDAATEKQLQKIGRKMRRTRGKKYENPGQGAKERRRRQIERGIIQVTKP